MNYIKVSIKLEYFFPQSNFNLFIQIECWRHEPDERPDINQVISELKSIDDPENNVNSGREITNNESSEENEDKHFADCYLPN